VPVVAGEKFFRHFWAKSFLVTEDYSPYLSLEALLRDQPQLFMGPAGQHRKRILLKEISRLARKMHQQGFNHLDFNATHILVHYENGLRPPKLALFDFQRVDKRIFLKFRWKIKSLARLNYSLPVEIFTENDRMYLFLSYLNKDNLQSFDRLQWIWFKRKTARIKHHTDKILARRRRMNN
jgi:heptose I phosphotransferase